MKVYAVAIVLSAITSMVTTVATARWLQNSDKNEGPQSYIFTDRLVLRSGERYLTLGDIGGGEFGVMIETEGGSVLLSGNVRQQQLLLGSGVASASMSCSDAAGSNLALLVRTDERRGLELCRWDASAAVTDDGPNTMMTMENPSRRAVVDITHATSITVQDMKASGEFGGKKIILNMMK